MNEQREESEAVRVARERVKLREAFESAALGQFRAAEDFYARTLRDLEEARSELSALLAREGTP